MVQGKICPTILRISFLHRFLRQFSKIQVFDMLASTPASNQTVLTSLKSDITLVPPRPRTNTEQVSNLDKSVLCSVLRASRSQKRFKYLKKRRE